MVGNNASGDLSNTNGPIKKSGGMGAPAKGILKSSQNADQQQQSQATDSSFLIASDVQLPNGALSKYDVLDGNNTTSRINTLALQDKVSRRVSFAPDVTLHSFDFVPETKTIREPRRRANDILVTSTQNEELNDYIEDESVSMDLTSPVAVSKPVYKPVFDQEVSMEITQLFPKQDDVQATDREETMEFTAVQDPSNNAMPEQSTMEITEVHSFKQPVEAEIPETPPSSKRRKLNEPVNDSVDPESSLEQDMELSMMEKLSPIRITSTEPKVVERETQELYSLQEFLDSTGLSFFIDTGLLEKTTRPIAFEAVEPLQQQNLRLNKLLNVLYLDTPVLEMNAFICKELLHRIEQSKKQFDDLDRQINTASPPPLLLSEYFNSNDEIKQSMNQQLQLVKRYSRLKAEKSWLEWRFQHLNGIKVVLEENLAIVSEENTKVEAELSKARETRSKALALREAIRKEITLLKDVPPDGHREEKKLGEKLRLEKLKQELALHAVDATNIKNSAEKNDELRRKIADKTAQLLSLKEEIRLLNQNRFSTSKKVTFTEYDIKKYSAKLELLGLISGVQFIQYKNSELTIKFAGMDALQKLLIDLSSLENRLVKPYEVMGAADIKFIFDHCYEKAINDSPVASSKQHLSVFLTSAKQAQFLMKEFSLLRLLFPVSIQLKDDTKVLEIRDFDSKTDSKVVYHLSFEEFLNAAMVENSAIHLRTTIIRKGHSTTSSSPTAFLKEIAKILPWFNESRVLLQNDTAD